MLFKMGKEKEKAVCCHCDKQFTKTSNMYQHIREVHGVEPVNFGRLKCPGCGSNFPNYECIRNHITKQHNIKCELEEHLFSNEKGIFITYFSVNLHFLELRIIIVLHNNTFEYFKSSEHKTL